MTPHNVSVGEYVRVQDMVEKPARKRLDKDSVLWKYLTTCRVVKYTRKKTLYLLNYRFCGYEVENQIVLLIVKVKVHKFI